LELFHSLGENGGLRRSDCERTAGARAVPELKASERAAVVTVALVQGRKLTTRDVAELAKCSQRTAQRTMTTIERVIPIVPVDGKWQMMSR
jgi:hypothetical protein